ncbi:MAG TPA: glycosyltransferase [Solirubrobacterales bacterium]|nr:glycosyltransferase [Solirubrobacterales bacterium]
MAGRRERIAVRARQLSRPTTLAALARSAAWNRRADCVPAGVPEPAAAPTIEWPTAYGSPIAEWFMRPLVRGFGRWATVVPAQIEQRGEGMVLCRASHGGRTIKVAIDYLDLPTIEAEIADEVDLYFKLQHASEGYGRANVVPGGYVQPRNEAYDHYCRLRAWGAKREGAPVYGRFGTTFGAPVREQAVGLLQGRAGLGYDGGLATVPLVESLQEAAAASVCVDLPGKGPFCYRLVDYLAVGACVVAAPHGARLQAGLVDREHIVYTKPDLSDLPDLCEWLLEDGEARRRIGAAGGAFFERYLHYLPLTSYYVTTILETLEAS